MSEEKNIKNYIKDLLILYWTMFRIGVCTFGGGYVMIGIIQKELAEKKKWINEQELVDYIAISQITPGVIAINVSTFVGRKMKGIPGAIAATLGVISPSIIIIIIIAALLTNFAENEYVMHAFAGIRICVCAVIANAVVGFIKKTVIDPLTIVVFACVFIVAAFTNAEVIVITLVAIAVSVVLTIIRSGKQKNAVREAARNSAAEADSASEKDAESSAEKDKEDEQ